MSEITFFVPKTDMMHKDHYDLLDSIFISAGIADDGNASFNEHAFRKYTGKIDVFQFPEYHFPFFSKRSSQEPVVLYIESRDDKTMVNLSAYGLFVSGVPKLEDMNLVQLVIDPIHLPSLAQICKTEIKASRRIVEELSYQKFIEHGHHGNDLRDWLVAEWEANNKIKEILNNLALLSR